MDTLTVERSPRPAPEQPRPVLRLLFTGGRIGPVSDTPLSEGTLVIGRKPAARRGLTLSADPLLSRSHASLHWRSGRLTLVDNDSRNGTFVNGQPIQRTALSDGDVIRLADTFLLLRYLPPTPVAPTISGLVGVSPAMSALKQTLITVASSQATVVLLGESGVGKGQSAKAIHRLSGRSGPFVAVNCATIPENLAESTLFGHVRGAFTGADASAAGLFQSAAGGTLLLDEIGDLPASVQPRLLHAVEASAVLPVGATRPGPTDVRLIAATNVPLQEAVERGHFRSDLYARLAELVVQIPPLRARREDVLTLLGGFLGNGSPPLEPDLVERLLLERWPLNVRELKNTATELRVRGAGQERLSQDLIAWRLTEPPPPLTEQPLAREPMIAALTQSRGVVSEAARSLGCSRRHLYRLLKRHGIDPDTFRDDR